MEILDVISSKREIAQRFLRDLVRNYLSMDDNARIERANVVFENIDSYLQIEQNLIFPLLEKTDEYQDILARTCTVHNKIEEIEEKAVMVHVDEPDHQFDNSMKLLLDLMDEAEKVDNELIFPLCRRYMGDADQFTMLSRLKEQTAHETVAPLEWQQTMFREKPKPPRT